MKWMETIKLRVAENNQEPLIRQLAELLCSMKREEGLREIKLFHNVIVDSDLSIHLYWETARVERQGSAPGLCLMHVLKTYGLISYSVWIESAGSGNLEMALN
jgi:hypothetical protein